MRKIVLSTALAFLAALLAPMQAQDNEVRIEISDGIEGALKERMETAASALMTAINTAYHAQSSALPLNEMKYLEPSAVSNLSALWEHAHFYCDDAEVVQICLHSGDGYQIRQIPLMITPEGESEDDTYQEGVICFNSQGNITRVNFTLSTNIYQDIMSRGKTVTEVRRRQEILSYVEQFRTAYNEMDLPFIERIFSENALIITGLVTTVKTADISFKKVTYREQPKKVYLANLRRSFAANKWINVRFDEVKVVKHPHPKMEGFYGVTVHQLYSNSRGYSDDGYLFMLWDFRNEDSPQIHVRTWQPRWMNDAKTEELPKEEIFTPGDFVIDI